MDVLPWLQCILRDWLVLVAQAGRRESCQLIAMVADSALCLEQTNSNLGASIITYIILGAPYYIYSIMGPETLF